MQVRTIGILKVIPVRSICLNFQLSLSSIVMSGAATTTTVLLAAHRQIVIVHLLLLQIRMLYRYAQRHQARRVVVTAIRMKITRAITNSIARCVVFSCRIHKLEGCCWGKTTNHNYHPKMKQQQREQNLSTKRMFRPRRHCLCCGCNDDWRWGGKT